MQMNLKPNSCLAKAGTLFFDYLVIFAGAVLYGISVAMFTSPNNVAPGGLTGVATMLNYMFSLPIGIMIFEPNITRLFDSIWYCFSVATTIGLGDVLATTLVGRVLSIFLSICSILIIAVVPGVITSYYVESTKLRADESSAKFLDDLERLPELSKEELVELSEKVKKFNRKK